jgi:hypothetical protein
MGDIVSVCSLCERVITIGQTEEVGCVVEEGVCSVCRYAPKFSMRPVWILFFLAVLMFLAFGCASTPNPIGEEEAWRFTTGECSIGIISVPTLDGIEQRLFRLNKVWIWNRKKDLVSHHEWLGGKIEPILYKDNGIAIQVVIHERLPNGEKRSRSIWSKKDLTLTTS